MTEKLVRLNAEWLQAEHRHESALQRMKALSGPARAEARRVAIAAIVQAGSAAATRHRAYEALQEELKRLQHLPAGEYRNEMAAAAPRRRN